MRRVTGIGGIFFKSKDPAALAQWYAQHLGLKVEDWGGVVFRWADDNASGQGSTIWSPFMDDIGDAASNTAPFIVNFRVADLHALLAALRAEGCTVDDKVEESDFGKFGWVTDPEGRRIELWEPPAGR